MMIAIQLDIFYSDYLVVIDYYHDMGNVWYGEQWFWGPFSTWNCLHMGILDLEKLTTIQIQYYCLSHSGNFRSFIKIETV